MTTEELLSGLLASENTTNPVSFSGGLDFGGATEEQLKQGNEFADFDPNSFLPARHRRTDKERYFAFAKDAFDYVSGLDGQGFLGKTEQAMNNYDKMRMEEDPEGYQIDMNRAKALAQKAYQSKDPEMKKKYGAAIKQLLPRETQGMDDLTASEFLVGSEKMEIEKLKAANRLAVQMAKNQGNLDTAGLKADSSERIAAMKAENALEIKMLDSEMRQALKDKDYEKAEMIQNKIMERTIAGKEMDFDRELMKQNFGYSKATDVANINADSRREVAGINAGSRENVAYINSNSRENVANINAGSRENVANINAASREKIAGINAKARVDAAKASGKKDAGGMDLIGDRTSQEMIDRMKDLNQKAGRWLSDYTYGASSARNSDAAKAYQEFEGLAKQIVQDQLRKVYGAQFTEKEGERFFKSMGLSYKMDEGVRWKLLLNQLNDLRAKAGYAPISAQGVVPAMSPVSQGAGMSYAPPITTGGNSLVNAKGFITL